ncbi:NUDIX hydrolase [Bradyrhizobium sp. 24]|uniref:NUDIX hydrolase n=2 Tax=Bradyrhizobium TaxID=374 RepID=UPI001FFAF9DF|nr:MULTISPECIES: NUDIX hydrolase [unclassified Bradyrhizobium]MCK1377625.1 NUDIX hydrolase [Bradyrhizobium sp. 24]MCK1292616.1 NUDIX hydrolase [Bradyrhizobium sp. 30]MCK1297407.1 NUDIX hydrolase [Bradyrhizobium sp. 37]MCK1346399.1 NUDIX hydrolase [Bradyrhizobium sp. CW11]MCK1351472.1 NUDIX hydrolase [Bradyrhizobium sp. CW7]
MEPQWLTYGKRLQAIASSGLHFARDQFDRERYEEIASIANEMLANLGSVPIERIEGLISDFAKGYATPKVDVRGAIVEENKVLLVREKSDGLWALPGGFADVGLSAAQNIAKELYEEAGLKVSVRRLYGVRHKAGASYSPDVRDFYKVFFLCDRLSGGEARPRLETSEAIFFPKDRLPPLSRGRTIESDVEAAFAFATDANKPAFFD